MRRRDIVAKRTALEAENPKASHPAHQPDGGLTDMRVLREAKGLTIEEVAERANMKVNHLRLLEGSEKHRNRVMRLLL